MPFEIILEKEIDFRGIDKGIDLYNKIKRDTVNYSVTKRALFNFGISYVNANKNKDALKLFSALESDYPNYFGGYYGSAIIYQQENNIKKAIEYYKKTITYSSEKEKWASNHSKKMINELLE